jgi:hypothetical protein
VGGTEAVSPYQRNRLRTLVQGHPGRTAAELETLLSISERILFAGVLRATRECCMVRMDDDGRIWAT